MSISGHSPTIVNEDGWSTRVVNKIKSDPAQLVEAYRTYIEKWPFLLYNSFAISHAYLLSTMTLYPNLYNLSHSINTILSILTLLTNGIQELGVVYRKN